MKIIERGRLNIIASNLKENTAPFESGKSYKKGERVLFERYIYEAGDETSDTPDPIKGAWKRVGVSNEFAPFDFYLNTAGIVEKSLELSVHAFGARALFLGNLKAKHLSIEVLDSRTGALLEAKEYRLFGHSIASWSDYFFGSWRTKSRHNVYYELSTLAREVTFKVHAWGLAKIELGMFYAGGLQELGTTLHDKNSLSILDFSRVKTDESGITELQKGAFKRTHAFNLLVQESQLDLLAYALAEARGEARVFVVSNYFESFVIFGFLKHHEILLSKPSRSIVSVEIEGLI